MSESSPTPAYMSTGPFNKVFFSYTDGVGLTPVAGANASNCPAGRILQLNRKKLYPGIHTGVKTIMTGVYDLVTQFSGFINVYLEQFILYDSNLTSGNIPELENTTKGHPVYTLGDVVAGGQFYSGTTIDLGREPNINADFTGTTYYTITLRQDTILSAINVPPNKGTVIYIVVYSDGISTLDFNRNFSGLVKQIPPLKPNEKAIVGFISDGITLTSMTSSLPSTPTAAQIITF